MSHKGREKNKQHHPSRDHLFFDKQSNGAVPATPAGLEHVHETLDKKRKHWQQEYLDAVDLRPAHEKQLNKDTNE